MCAKGSECKEVRAPASQPAGLREDELSLSSGRGWLAGVRAVLVIGVELEGGTNRLGSYRSRNS